MASSKQPEQKSSWTIWIVIGAIVVIALLAAAFFQGDDVSDDVQKEADRLVEVIEGLREVLPAKYAEDLDTIEVYIIRNPSVVEDSDPDLPEEVQEAVDNVREALLSSGSSDALEDVDVGDKLTISGVIEKSEYEGGPFENAYVVDDEKYGELYFVFTEEESEAIDENLLGEEVEIDIEVTEKEGGYISYVVLAGPRPVEAEE